MWKGTCKKRHTKSLTPLSNLKSHISIFCPTWKNHAIFSNLNSLYKVRCESIIFHSPFKRKKLISMDTRRQTSSTHLARSESHMQITYSYFVLKKKQSCILKYESLSFPLRSACSKHLPVCARDFSFGTRCAIGSDAQRSEVRVTES